MPVQILDGTGSSNFMARVTSNNELLVTGSVNAAVSVATGSEVYIKAGSVQTYNPIGIGSVVITNNPVPVSGIVQIGGALSSIGSYTTQTISGTVTVDNRVAGSIVNMPIVGVSGTALAISGVVNPTPGSVYQLSSPGSHAIFAGVTSVFGVSGGVVGVSGTLVGVSGTAFNTVWLGTGSVVISGTAVVAPSPGSNYLLSTPGSVGVYAALPFVQVEPTRGVFGSSGNSFIASGTAANIITPGAGSKILLKGFTASAVIPTTFRLIFSGGTATYIGTWSVPGSGTVAMNMLGMEPSGATNQPIAVGLINAGSLYLSVFTRDTL